MNIATLQEKRTAELHSIARGLGIANFAELSRPDLIYCILETYAEGVTVEHSAEVDLHVLTNGRSQRGGEDFDTVGLIESQPPAYMLDFDPKKVALTGMIHKTGVLEVLPDGYGFLRSADYRYHPSADDIYVSPSQIKRFSLQVGDVVKGEIRPPREGQRFFALIHVDAINGRSPESFSERKGFDFLAPTSVSQLFRLETTSEAIAPRILDLFCPIGKGHRGLIVAPPESGTTKLLQQIAQSLSTNHPNVRVLALLINERSDDIMAFEQHTNADVVATLFGDAPDRHVHLAGLIFEAAKRLVEAGHDVVLLIDSMTELVRGYNTLSLDESSPPNNVLDTGTFNLPKALFGSAKAVEDGGSLTVIASMQVGAGNDLDEKIYAEFKGVSNTTIVLSAELASHHIFPAIDIKQSHTREEEALIQPDHLDVARTLRRQLLEQEPKEAMLGMVNQLKATKSNAEFLAQHSSRT